MSRRGRRVLWALLVAGTVGRAVVGVTTFGRSFDVESFYFVRDALANHGTDVYTYVWFRWPYPPGSLSFFPLADWISGWSGIEFGDVVQAPAIAADAAIACLVQVWLARRGATERMQLGAVAAVMFGPVFAVISGYHTQIDSVAVLPAVAGVMVWVLRPEDRYRWLWAGLLIGAGASIKTTPGLMLLAVLPTARSVREGIATAVAVAAVPLAAAAPFLLSDADGVARILEYQGLPGAGGLTMILQPELLSRWLADEPVLDMNALVQWVYNHNGAVMAVLLGCIAPFLVWARADPIRAAILIWLALYAFGPGFFFQYLVWGLPFFLMAGYLRQTVVLQLSLVVPIVLLYREVTGAAAEVAYFVFMAGVWLAFVAAFALVARQLVRSGRATRGTSPPGSAAAPASSR